MTANVQATSDGDEAITYQWQSSSDGGQTWSNIAGATASTYQVGEADEGHQLQIVASLIGDAGAPTLHPQA